jgi:hypothetical protein
VFYGHGDGFARFRTVIDELDGLSFCFWVLSELLEPSPLDEELDGILQMDAVIGGVSMAFVESTILCFVDPLPLLRRSLWWLDANFVQIGHNDLGEDFLP